jgi:hypothetical protein
MSLDAASVKNAVAAVKAGKHTPNHVATLRKTKQFLAANKSHEWNKSAALHHAFSSLPGLKEWSREVGRRLIESYKGKFDPKELKMGIEVEKEHGDRNKSTDVFKKSDAKNRKRFEKIAKAHLKEIPDYYTRLKKMEREGKKAHGISEGIVKDVLTHDVGSAHPRPGKLAWWMRPVRKPRERDNTRIGKHNPQTFYPAGNMMRPGSAATPTVKTGSPRRPRWVVPVVATTAVAAGAYGTHEYRKYRLAKKKEREQERR